MEKVHHTRQLPDHPAFRPPKRRAKGLVLWWVVLLLVAGVGVYWWQHSQARKVAAEVRTLQHEVYEAQKNHRTEDEVGVRLGERVWLMPPEGWQKLLGSSDCPAARASLVCEAREVIAPKATSEAQFSIDLTAYQNRQNRYAKDWFLNVYRAGQSGEGTLVEEHAINGYSAAYTRDNGGSPQDVYYVLSAQDRAVVVHARLFAKGEPDQDFRAQLPAVDEVAAALRFEERHD